MDLKKEIREILNYPKEGIGFKDLTTLMKNKEAFNFVVNEISGYFKNRGITKVVGMEARGFIFGGAIAAKLGAGFVPIRKRGKLPAPVISETYTLEYGEDQVEMHRDAINENDIVLIHDDLLATGGTAKAALEIVRKIGVKKVYFSFVCDLEFIKTDMKDEVKSHDIQILVTYQ
ncbi:MAG: adenine phosphoribosyltransferase [Draconibacterium sp.]|nr:MAG: adenine phosphoribosyltransferase [Draconibacterium sp.]